ncbi:MAG TPA: hypothetical protein VKX17_05840 [Planctomycetota bacterium]|nr:hypothetical protein [Planctomycetota bacterium]
MPYVETWALRCTRLACIFLATAACARAETALPDPTDGVKALKDFAPRSPAEIIDAPKGDASGPDGTPRATIAIDGEVYLGAWRKLEGRVMAADQKPIEVEWTQAAGPSTSTPAEAFKQRELWLFLTKPGNYAFTFRAKNQAGWSAPAQIRFAVLKGRPYVSEAEGLRLAGSGERVELPGAGWKQISGPPAVLRPSETGLTVRPNDAGLYIFEAAALQALPSITDPSPRAPLAQGLTGERRGIRVPPGKDGKVGDRRPVAMLPRSLNGVAGRPLILDGSLSADPDTEDQAQLKARWIAPDKARGVSIESQPGLRAALTAEQPGTYRIALIVSDGRLDSLPAEVFVEIAAGPANTDQASAIRGDGSGGGALSRNVSLAIWPAEPDAEGNLIVPDDSGLERAVQLFPKRCDVALLIDPSVARPGHFKEFPLALEASHTPLRHLLDGIARQTSTRYRADGERGFWLIKPSDSCRDEALEPVAAGVDALHEKADAADLMLPLQEYLKPARARDGASVAFQNERIVGMLPKTAGAHLKEIAAALREPTLNTVPAPTPPTPAEEALHTTLGDALVTQRGRFRLDRLLRELAESAKLSIGFDPRDFPKGIPYVKIAYENAPLRQVLRDLVDEVGFDGCSIEAPAGVWFYKGERPFPSGECLWDTAVVRAYDLKPVLAALTPEAANFLTGEVIAHKVRSMVYPASWNDPGTLIFFHAPTQKLVVLHAPEAQRRVVELLNDFCERGEWALGGSE